MMNKWLLIISIIPILLSSCRDTDNVSTTTGTKNTVHLSFTVAGLKSANATRNIDPTTVNDTKVNDLWVLQFQSGTLTTATFLSSVDTTGCGVKMTAGTSNVYFIANAGSTAFSSFTVGTTTETTFQSTTKSLSSETAVLENSTYVPMYGSLSSVTIPSTGYYASSVTLTRMLARVTVTFSNTASNFGIRKIRICNVPNVMYYYPPASTSTSYPASPSGTTVSSYDYTDVSSTSGTYTFYVPENQRGTGTNTSGTDATKKTGVSYATYIQLVGYMSSSTIGQEVVYNLYPGANNYNDYNICRNTYYTISATIAGVSTADARVTKTPRANCYIVSPGNSVYIPLARANDSALGTQISNVAATSGYTFGVLWQDNSSSTSAVTCSQSSTDQTYGVFKVTVASTYTGNAVVYVKNSSGTILWSWHIWATTYNPSLINGTIGSYTFMDRNLGATSNTLGSQTAMGTFYQWGRKDPYPCAVSYTSSSYENIYSGGASTSIPSQVQCPSSNNLANSVANPTIPYYDSVGPYDWYTNTLGTQIDTLWTASKTVYDPCPSGWYVAPNAAYSSTYFSTSTMTYYGSGNGWTHTASNTWWPSVLWTSTGYTTGSIGHPSYTLVFTSSAVVASNNMRSAMYSLRCVKSS